MAELIYPILKAHDWIGKQHGAVYWCYLDSDKPPMPVVAYGHETPESYVFVRWDDLGDRPPQDLHDEALANLVRLELSWERVGDLMLTASGTPFSAEKMLDDAFILEAQRLLGSDAIQVAVPRRTVIYAIDARRPPGDLAKFFAIVRRTFRDDSFGNAPITPLVFRFQGNAVAGVKEIEA